MKQMTFDLKKYNFCFKGNHLIVKERKETAAEWVKRMVAAYQDDYTTSTAVHMGRHVCILDDKGNVGKATCAPSDEFDYSIGRAIAYARVKGFPIHPDFVCDDFVALDNAESIEIGAHVKILATAKVGIIESRGVKNPHMYKVRVIDSGEVCLCYDTGLHVY